MANTLNLGNGNWAAKEGSLLAYNDENGNFKPLPFDFTRASSATRVNSQGLIEVVGSDQPRVDYSSGEGALLLEPQRTNLMPYSEAIEEWQRIRDVTVESNTTETLSPEGVYNAVKLTATTTDPYIFESINVTANPHTMSFYVKGVGDSIGKVGNILFWYVYSATGASTSHNFTLTGDWQRIEATTTPTGAGILTFRIDIPADLSVIGDEAYIYGVQVEAGSYATSYIPTQGAAVTRVAEVCNGAGNDQVINSTEGVLYVEMAATSFSSNYDVITLSDGTNNNLVGIFYLANNKSINVNVKQLGSSVFTGFASTITYPPLDFHKIAVKYKTGDFALWIDGTEVLTGSGAFTNLGLSNLQLADGNGTSNKFFGKVKELQVFTTALTDAELIALTTI